MPLSKPHTQHLKHLPGLYQRLVDRIGFEALDRRLHKQFLHEHEKVFQGKNFIKPDKIPGFFATARLFLKTIGLWNRGYREFLTIELVENSVFFPHLPEALDGFRLLQLSDLHIDLDPSLVPIILEHLQELHYDAAVITGDYRDDTKGEITDCLEFMKPIIEALTGPRFGILGNHDAIELLPPLEDMGLPMLMNETATVPHQGDALYISGIDDPHYYEGHDFEKLKGTVPEGAFSILLSHAPETFHEAEALGYDFVIGGHTHAGQICLPSGIALLHNGACPRHMLRGNWRYGNLQGYTARGTGACQIPIRLFCPGEITVHTLRRGEVPEG